jgi:hypothetical protein
LQKLERFWGQSVHRTNPNKTAERLGTRPTASHSGD